MSYPSNIAEPDEKYPDDIETVEEPLEEEEELPPLPYTDEEIKQALETDSAIEKHQLGDPAWSFGGLPVSTDYLN